ncbi:MAG: tRNA 2-selenouridine(34) synthase MnmH [Bacteroidota bacterium]
MAFPVLDIDEFLNFSDKGEHVIIDARSESEFAHAHIPGAINIPILNDEERKLVGTEYKQKGKEAAVHLGFRLVGPRFHEIITDTIARAGKKNLLLYCWRGGMRSNILGWLLSINGFSVKLLNGGYKSFRNFVLNTNAHPRNFIVLGGATGSGKTETLAHLTLHGQAVIDLEAIANHKGSAFGLLGRGQQPSNEQFENRLALKLRSYEVGEWIWVENESRTIGCCALPEAFYNQMRKSPVVELNVSLEVRMQRITQEYGSFSIEELTFCSEKVKKRLGPQHLKMALELLHGGDFQGWLRILMEYYDKQYSYGNQQRDSSSIFSLDTNMQDIDLLAQKIIEKKNVILKQLNG